MNSSDIAKWFAAVAGASLVLVGLLGFISNPIVGDPPAIFHTGALHNIVHLATGVLALYIAFGLTGVNRANALIGYGVLYAAVLVVTLVSPNLFGLFEHPVNMADHVLHILLAVGSIAIGWWARSELSGAGTPRTAA